MTDTKDTDGCLRFAVTASYAVAILLAVTSLGGLLMPSAYARATPDWATQAIVQDWFDLVVASPALFLAALATSRGSRRGRLVLGGLLLFVVYTLLIYAFAIHLNAMFLGYCAGLGLALYATIALARATAPATVARSSIPRRAVAGFLVVLGLAFAALWLRQLVPAALTGRVPAELAATGLLTNPIHVIDLSFILPLHLLAGVLVWRRRPLGDLLAPVVLVFGAVMAASIGCLTIAMRGPAPVIIGMWLIATWSLVLSVWTLRGSRGRSTQDIGEDL